MAIDRTSSAWRFAARLVLAVLLGDIAAAAALTPIPGSSGLFADLARICRADREPTRPSGHSDDICVFCLPLAGGAVARPGDFVPPMPVGPGIALPTPDGAGPVARAPAKIHQPRGPPAA